MKMEMRHTLPRILSAIDYYPEPAPIVSALASDLPRDPMRLAD
jgi:hypothetical protein